MPRSVAVLTQLFLFLYALTTFARQPPNASDVVAIDVLIDPDSFLIQRAVADNAKLRGNYPKGYSLDAAHAPHISLVQRYVSRKDLGAIEAAVTKVLQSERPLPINLTATKFDSVMWAGVAVVVYVVERSSELIRLENKIVDAVQPFAVKDGSQDAFVRTAGEQINADTMKWVRDFVPASSGENYIPHITVGTALEDFAKKLEAEPFHKIDFKGVGIAFYQLGNFGTAQKRLWSAHQ